MTEISASLVKELRERTGMGMMDCKQALLETNGDISQAIEELRKSSGIKASKKAGRSAADGILQIQLVNSKGFMVEINCETDFVSKDGSSIKINLEDMMDKYMNDDNLIFDTIQIAWDNANKYYSFESVKQRILNLL